MAVPGPDKFTILDISGKFYLNKTLSDSTDEILRLQGVSWLKRKAISIGTVTLYIKHYKDDDGIEKVDIDQTVAGISGTSEKRSLTWTERENNDDIFGYVIGKSRRVKLGELEEEFLKAGWTEDTVEHGVIQAYAASDTPKSGTTWIANQTWGVEEVNGERRYARHIKFAGPAGEDIQARLVYDYEPRAFLDIDVTFRGRRLEFPLESTLIRLTRPFTSPWLLAALIAAYIIGLAFFIRAQSYLTPSDAFIGCTDTFWLANNGCGVDGETCAPFNDSSMDFRCPAQCSTVTLQNPRTVGDEQTAYVPLVVGGGDANVTYRGDSFICAAAVQAGLISDSKGGCASLTLIGNYTNFLPTTGHGITSIGFATIFPLSFRFLDYTSLTHCVDYRNPALAFNILVTCLLFLILRPKPLVLYWCLISVPRLGTFLPALFIAYVFWRLAFRFTLPLYAKAPIEYMVWYLGPYWVGVLSYITLEAAIPINRLTSSDLTKRSGAITALVVIVIIVVVLVLNQVRVIRKTGWLPYYAGWYVVGGLVVLVLALLPGLEIRLHHYIIAMVLIPGTAFPTRLSAIYQGLLLGLFLNGAAAYGFDSVLQTADELRQDAPLGSDLPTFLTNSTNYNASILFENQTIAWDSLPAGWDGFALLVDDVERYVGTALNFSLAAFNQSLPHFFRLALTSEGNTGDFTMPATLWPNGSWVDPLPGPS
ncbi:hypothetical protein IW261DRAFT_1551663 [Armillaria novae-zelandiae]|uniref:LCCL domain-containing protein n=1 Tax=Armillaria novae-zelandiae TaxID=153914 RepID=A0AA39P7G2_9AGAR|nr:hypothetical protein IW261DRAFT_1551663 [Armillaria novae-zelandiae]